MDSRSAASSARLLEHLDEHPLITVVREAQDGDRHELHPTTRLPYGVDASAVPVVLEQLERDGLVERVEQVHPDDSSEYLVTWQRVAPEHRTRVAGRGGASIREAVADRTAAQAPGGGGRP